LFVAKNTYAFALILLVGIAGLAYPFSPRNLTLISSVTIGIPAFVLALGPNVRRYRPGFLRRVLTFAVPAGAINSLAIFAAYLAAELEGFERDESRTAATIAALVSALWILSVLARPYRPWKVALVVAMAAIAAGALVIPVARDFFEIDTTPLLVVTSLAIGAAGAVGVEVVARLAPRWANPDDG
ncbi:MAG: hypothetical protein KDA97_03435, partial [Acidimicrobiales bacterium]|nr:hypothetical protein [Acidimicrobiales bacterium]